MPPTARRPADGKVQLTSRRQTSSNGPSGDEFQPRVIDDKSTKLI
jgi:hypothetical protein